MPQYNEGFALKLILEGCRVSPLWCETQMACETWNGCERNPLACKTWVQEVIRGLCRHIGMTERGFFAWEEIHPDDSDLAGASCVLGIAESGIQGHGWGERNAFRVLIDSCKDYSVDRVLDYLAGRMRPQTIEAWVEEQGFVFSMRRNGIDLFVARFRRLIKAVRRRGALL